MTSPNILLLPLSDLSNIPTPPKWFSDALARPYHTHVVQAAGINIEARSWGDPHKPGLLFVHGNAAHIGWWSFLAPLFADDYHVVTYSLGGMGESDWRDAYSSANFSAEMWAVADATGLTAGSVPPIIVAHSMGGMPLIHSASTIDRPIRAAILVDVALPGPEMISVPSYPGHRMYSTQEAALGRFRLSPLQPCANRWIAEYLGRMAIKEVAGADGASQWTWRFDPKLWGNVSYGDIWGELATMRCPVAIFKGGLSTLTDGPMNDRMVATAPAGSPYIVVPEANHHIMIDQPMAMVTGLRTLFHSWVK